MTFWLGAMTACLAIMAGALAVVAWTVRRTFQHFSALLPQCDHTLREAGKTLTEARQILSRTQAATRQVATVVDSTCQATSALMQQVVAWTRRAKRWWNPRRHQTSFHRVSHRRESA